MGFHHHGESVTIKLAEKELIMSSERRINTNNLFETFLGFDNPLFNSTFDQSRNFPPHDVLRDSEDMITIKMALAGYKKDNVEVTFVNDTLTVKGQGTKLTPDITVLKSGISSKDFSISWAISADYEISSAKMEDGLLMIQLIKRPDTKPQKIEIK